MKFRLIAALLLALLTLPVMAQDKALDASAQKRFQGNWLAAGCFAKNEPVAFSFSISGDVITFHQMAKANTQEVLDLKEPNPGVHGIYKFYKDGKPILTFDGYSFPVLIYDGGTDGFQGVLGGISLSYMSHGSADDLKSYAGAHAPFCANFQEEKQ
jgi:hypothetical protein